jgi:hypothetical protein
MATRAHNTNTPSRRRFPSALIPFPLPDAAASRGRRLPAQPAQNAPALGLSAHHLRIEATLPPPTHLQRTLSYIANGDLPPLPRVAPAILDGLLSFSISTAACLALGVLIGQEIAR